MSFIEFRLGAGPGPGPGSGGGLNLGAEADVAGGGAADTQAEMKNAEDAIGIATSIGRMFYKPTPSSVEQIKHFESIFIPFGPPLPTAPPHQAKKAREAMTLMSKVAMDRYSEPPLNLSSTGSDAQNGTNIQKSDFDAFVNDKTILPPKLLEQVKNYRLPEKFTEKQKTEVGKEINQLEKALNAEKYNGHDVAKIMYKLHDLLDESSLAVSIRKFSKNRETVAKTAARMEAVTQKIQADNAAKSAAK